MVEYRTSLSKPQESGNRTGVLPGWRTYSGSGAGASGHTRGDRDGAIMSAYAPIHCMAAPWTSGGRPRNSAVFMLGSAESRVR